MARERNISFIIRNRLGAAAPSLALGCVLAGCASAVRFDRDATAAREASAPDAGEPPCGALRNVGGLIATHNRPEPRPDPLGGPIPDGTYVLTDAVNYTGPGGSSGPTEERLRITMRVAAPRFEVVKSEGGEDQRYAGVLTASGVVASFVHDCPAGVGTGNSRYTAAANTLTFFAFNGSGIPGTSTYTRR